ncbi:hypothetical protein [Sinorhizobium sp. RAC02]|uniref:hypothetical protein n=1 Tax=Sinorhizobium sp. RAC02 TaxID=1842534 RepID=UPI00083CF2DE|nr:hypothetical protein [Sinorhizobium sp. RAC02]AOF93904.1 hypothetical protein BSY16_5745 [Sinorhizobium sp. RAC02]
MKSPWKLLANLISRGRSAELEHGTNSDNAEATARSGQSDEVLALSSASEASLLPRTDQHDAMQAASSNEDAGLRASPSAQIDGKRPEMLAQDRFKRGRPYAAVVAKDEEAGKKGRTGTRTKRSGVAKNTSKGAVTQNTPASDSSRGHSEPSQMGFYADMQRANEEILRLRSQLADALVVQNGQLKKMLERFGVS